MGVRSCILTNRFLWKRQSDGAEYWYVANGPVHSLQCVRSSYSGLWRCDLFNTSTQKIVTSGDESACLWTAIQKGEERFGARLEEATAEVLQQTICILEGH